MSEKKLATILNIVTRNLAEEHIPYALIGALALNLYGLPRYTVDIDLLSEARFSDQISSIMTKLGYTCFQRTKSFAQFDSDLGIMGKIDFMFVQTSEGEEILGRSARIDDPFFGQHPVIQPTDYIILKLLALANNPERLHKDQGDIIHVLKLFKANLLSDNFKPLDQKKIEIFAQRFGQEQRIRHWYAQIKDKDHGHDLYQL